VSLRTFEAVTGPKTDHWLVIALGLVVAIIGGTLLLAAFRRRVSLEIFVLAIGSAAMLAGVDFACVVMRRIPFVYLLDFVAEALLIALWIFAAKRERHRMVEPSAALADTDASPR
jgi:hypothetical protein